MTVEAQKLTLDDIQSKIESAIYLQPTGTLTIAILTLTNGYTVTGESACLNPADFDADMGKKIAYENAEKKIWMLEGYLRKEAAFQSSQPNADETPAPLPVSGKSTESVSSAGQTTVSVDLPTVAVPPHDDMVPYLGVKIVNAKPMPRGIYAQLRGWDLPTDEDPADAGYLVEYTDAQRPNVSGFAGYVSWSPADVFMAAYNPLPAPAPQADTGNVSVSTGSTPAASNGPTAGGVDLGNAQSVGGAGTPTPPTSGSTDAISAPTASPSSTIDSGTTTGA